MAMGDDEMTKLELRRKAAVKGMRVLPYRHEPDCFELVRCATWNPITSWPTVFDEAGKPVRGTLQRIEQYLESFCPKCGENLHMNYHDAAGNCVMQPL